MAAKQLLKVDGRELSISNLDKIFYPESSFTKGETIAFYSEMAEVILPHLKNRPLTLKRYPDGIRGEHFYEKNAPSHTPAWVEKFAVPRSEGGEINYILCNDRPTLLWATNLGDIEKHILLARAPELGRPTSVVFDLDPGESATILDCARVALQLRTLFESWKLQAFVKVSGSKGLHLTVPLNTEVTYEMTQPFAKAVAELGAQQWPDLVVSEMAKSLRRGKVLIDWSQNSDFKTTVSVYAMRAKEGGPFVSLPVSWEELGKAVQRKNEKALFFTPAQAVRRIARVGDLFEKVLTLRQELPAAFMKALAAAPPIKLNRWPSNRDKSLREYVAKRDPTRTPEPLARLDQQSRKKSGPLRFVIQKHQASHLHYDWRLEMEGVLRSWAVPKGPPTTLREARLAMHVEDHPLEYADFEGTIPPGNYGAGTVMVWDFGEYQDLTEDPAQAFHDGKMHIVMAGQKLTGEWILVKDKREPESNRWLLIKAGESMPPFSEKVDDSSAISRRSMAAIKKANDAQWQSNRPNSGKRRTAEFIEPMQCKAVTSLPEDGNWSFEIKFDGYRCIAVKQGSELQLFSRNQNKLNARYPNVAAALEKVPGDFVLDGEIIALDEEGRPSFQLLQDHRAKPLEARFYAFDLLHWNGEQLAQQPIERRRAQLQELLAKAEDAVRISPLLEASASKVLDAIRELGLEGVVGKRNGSKYEAGARSGAWIKHRAERAQEFVIGGYTPGARGFDSLLVGVYEKKKLLFVAKVKDGFVPRVREQVFAKFKGVESKDCPFENLPEKKGARRGEAMTAAVMQTCRWLKPKLVCQVSFLEWTEAGHLRHCTFLALRDDKNASEVTREL